MASAFEMLVPSFASLASNSFEAFVAASFVPACPSSSFSFDVTSFFAASAGPPFLSAAETDSAAEEGDFGFAAGADMFGLDGPLLVRGLVLPPRAETEEGAA